MAQLHIEPPSLNVWICSLRSAPCAESVTRKMCIRDSSWGVFFMFSSVGQKVCLLTLLFLAFKLLFEKILHHFFAFIRTD